MTHKKLIDAYATLMRMSTVQIPIKAARDLYTIRKAIEPIYQFCAEQERVIVNGYNGKIANGTISFDDEDNTKKAQKDLQDLYALEAEYGLDPVTVHLDDIINCKMSLNDMETLDGFVVLV